MDKRKSKNNMILNITTITIINYILFSTQGVSFFPFVAIILLGYIFFSCDKEVNRRILIAYSILLSAVVYGTTFGFENKENVFSYMMTSSSVHILSIILVLGFIKKYNFKKNITNLSLGNIALYVAELAKYKYIDKIVLSDEIKLGFTQFINKNFSVISSTISTDDINLLDLSNQLKDILVVIVPLLLVISSIISAFFLYEFFRFIISTFTGKKFENNFKFRYFSVNGSLSIFAILMYIISVLSNNAMFSSVVVNFAFVASFLYVANGFSIIVFYLYKKIKFGFITVITSLILLYFALVSVALLPTFNGIYILFILGLFDNRFDFRKIRKLSITKI